MPSKLAYLDAPVLLSYVNDDKDRAPIVETILEDGDKPGLRLFTSELSIVEVAFGITEQKQQKLDADTEERINALWAPGTPINLVEYYRLIGEDAKELMRLAISKGWSLKPMDAIHLSTARRMEVAEFFTYDDKLVKYAGDVGFKICEPYTDRPRLPLETPES